MTAAERIERISFGLDEVIGYYNSIHSDYVFKGSPDLISVLKDAAVDYAIKEYKRMSISFYMMDAEQYQSIESDMMYCVKNEHGDEIICRGSNIHLKYRQSTVMETSIAVKLPIEINDKCIIIETENGVKEFHYTVHDLHDIEIENEDILRKYELKLRYILFPCTKERYHNAQLHISGVDEKFEGNLDDII